MERQMARPRFVRGTPTSVPWTGLKGELCHEYDQHGNHRITHNGRLGDWVSFAEAAIFSIDGRNFRAYTDYHVFFNEIEEVIAVLPRTFSQSQGV
jgi:hypothetical protein